MSRLNPTQEALNEFLTSRYTLFEDVSSNVLRWYNQATLACNLLVDFGEKFFQAYLNKLPPLDRSSVNKVLRAFSLVGKDEVARRVGLWEASE